MSTTKIVAVFTCAFSLAACSASKQAEWFVTHNGNMPSEERISRIEKGDSKDGVLAILGAPSAVTSFDNDTWLYMSSDVKRLAFMEPEEINRDILKITFNTNNQVTQIERLDKTAGKEITPSKEKTDVKGQNVGFFRKYFGGVGQYNPFGGSNNANRM